ncbi:MAG: hypothetical protein LQ347_007129 [Umbilicaria vellea]|nr:MAG: hypothetical protein LQ347_007129 [Umbilicaria vellea]
MLDPERARDEQNAVSQYFKVEEEEYEVEVEVEKDRDRDRDREREGGRRRIQHGRGEGMMVDRRPGSAKEGMKRALEAHPDRRRKILEDWVSE